MLDNLRFHHIGMAVRSIDDTAAVYVSGGYKMSSVIFDPIQNVNICWLSKEGMPLVELLAPVDGTSPVHNTLAKVGVAPYHICYITENIKQAIRELRQQKYVLVSKPAKAVAIHNSPVAFLYNRNVGLIELVETPTDI